MDKTLLKGLAVLEAATNLGDQVTSIEEFAAHVGLTRSNAHRTLQTLIHAGYIERDPDSGGFRGTMKMFELGARSLNRLDVRKIAPPFMAQLAKATRETVHLSVLEGLEVIYIDKIDSALPIRSYTTVGGRAPAYAVATGKALLAVQADDYLDQFPGRLARHTRSTIVDHAAVKRELAKSRSVGYAVNRGEWRDGVGGVAAALFDGSEKPVAALGISGPLDRLDAARMKEFGPLVVRIAMQLSKAMGYSKGHFGAAK
jgi:DNA-binding IclR family transcriptional regulator